MITIFNGFGKMTVLHKIGSCVYAAGEYRVEKMENGLWDAYLPHAFGGRLWQSPGYKTRRQAVQAISAEKRRVASAVRTALKRGI